MEVKKKKKEKTRGIIRAIRRFIATPFSALSPTFFCRRQDTFYFSIPMYVFIYVYIWRDYFNLNVERRPGRTLFFFFFILMPDASTLFLQLLSSFVTNGNELTKHENRSDHQRITYRNLATVFVKDYLKFEFLFFKSPRFFFGVPNLNKLCRFFDLETNMDQGTIFYFWYLLRKVLRA